MANTTIQIKRSLSTSDPGTLQFGELAYSFQSGKTFIGDENGNSVVIGGNTYIQMLDAATASNINNTIVKRDSSGNFTATTVTAELSGNASTASRWQTARTLGFDGDVSGSSSIDGSTNANTTLSLNSINATSGTFGGTSEIPVFTVNEKGLITHSANVSVSVASTLNIDTDNGSNTVSLISDTLSLVGGEGISTSVTNNDTISFDVDNTVIRSTGNQSKTGNFTLVGDLNVTGNTIFQGLLFEKNPDVVWGLIASLFIGNIVLLILNIPMVRVFAKVLLLPPKFLMPIIIIVSFVGVYGLTGSTFDLVMLTIFGILGWIFRKLDIPLVPVVMGSVLGNLMEVNLRRAMTISNGNWFDLFSSNICIILWLITFVAFILPMFLNIKLPSIKKNNK